MNFKKSCLAILIFLAVSFLQAQTISKISFSELKKTKESYLQKLTKRFYGLEATEKNLSELETVLQAEEIFETIDLSVTQIDDENSEILVTVKEKITFIPLPFLSYSDGDWSGGAMILNMNGFGTKTTVVSGVLVSSDMDLGLLLISKPPASTNDLGGSFMCSFTKTETSRTDFYGDPFASYKMTSWWLSTSVQKKTSEISKLSLGAEFEYKYLKNYSGSNEFYDSMNGVLKIFLLDLGWNLTKTDWNGMFLSTKSVKFEFSSGYDPKQKSFCYKNFCSALLQFPLTQRLRIIGGGGAVHSKNIHLTDMSAGSDVSVTILPNHFVSQNLEGISSGLEFGLIKLSFGLISAYGNFQTAIAENFDGKDKINHGFSCGSKLYLSKIAFPALAVGYSYNITSHKYTISGSLGVSM